MLMEVKMIAITLWLGLTWLWAKPQQTKHNKLVTWLQKPVQGAENWLVDYDS